MSFYHGFYSGTGELNSRNHMKHAEWFHPWAKHTLTVGKEMLVRAHVQFRSSSPWPVLHLPPSVSREVQPGCWPHLAHFLCLEVATKAWREAGWKGWAWVGEMVWFALCCQSQCMGIAGETCQGLPLGAPWSQAFPHYSEWKLKWLHFQWKKKKGKNVFRKLRSELVRCISVESNCSRLIDISQCPLLFLSIRHLK